MKEASGEKRVPVSSSWPVAVHVTINTTEDRTGNENAIAPLSTRSVLRRSDPNPGAGDGSEKGNTGSTRREDTKPIAERTELKSGTNPDPRLSPGTR